MNSIKFNRLLKKIKTDKEAFEQIYAEYYPSLVMHIKRHFGKTLCAEDLAHDLFLKLINMNVTKRIQYPASFLYKMADNMAVDQIRAQKGEFPLSELAVSSFNVESMLINSEVKKYFAGLDETTQNILYMHYWEGYSFKEIAAELGIKYGALRAKVSRAYKKFRELM